ncbi:MAG: hypothetical protein AAF571_04640 [Verrucomicrobiota bacterium]
MRLADWEIKPCADECALTGKSFEEDEEFYTLLFQDKEGLRRMDVRLDARDQVDESEQQAISNWKSNFKPKPGPEEETVGKQDAESELRRLLEKGEESTASLCRILALLLERKRMLKMRERIQQDGRSLLVYEHAETGESFIVPDVDFKLSELDSLRSEILDNTESKLFAVSVPVEAPAGAQPAES